MIESARLAQGEQEYLEASDATKREIIEQWHMRMEMKSRNREQT